MEAQKVAENEFSERPATFVGFLMQLLVDRKNCLLTAAELLTALDFLTKARRSDSTEEATQKFTASLLEVAAQFIRFPAEEQTTTQRFFDVGELRHGTGFPNVLAAVDCFPVELKVPKNGADEYLNGSTGKYTINVQVACGPDLQIYNALAAFPGSYSAGCIWKASKLRQTVQQCKNRWLLGGTNYPQEPWLMTPLSCPESPAEELYNKVHSSTWKCVQKCISLLKAKYQCLKGELELEPRKVYAIVTVCCILHNIDLRYGATKTVGLANIETVEEKFEEDLQEGVALRETLIRSRFAV